MVKKFDNCMEKDSSLPLYQCIHYLLPI